MKKFFPIFLVWFLIFAAIPGLAAPKKVVDEADLLTVSQEADLERRAEALASEHQIDVVILTVQSLKGKEPQAYADDFYDAQGYGVGANKSGVLFLISMEDRDWAISTTGGAIPIISPPQLDFLLDRCSSALGEDDFYTAFLQYLDALDDLLTLYENSPSDFQERFEDTYGSSLGYGPAVLISVIVGLIAATVTVLVMRGNMKTAKAKQDATDYMSGYTLYNSRDLFLYSHTHRVRISQDNNHSHGGGSIHVGSSGTSHGGGHGKF